jgi:YegS/Rv2252/BmrU family lipid kinase
MAKQKIYFLVNPISGGKKKDNFHALVSKNIDSEKYDYDIEEWGDNDTVEKLVGNALNKNFDIIVAAGGDGTINQVAAQLAGTGKLMGIIPMGSGNGFARHSGIPVNPEKAIQLLNRPTIKKVDTLLVNNNRYVNVAGVGFDAHIGYLFSTASTRGFSTYTKIVVKELSSFKPENYTLTIDGKEHNEDAFLISVTNGSQWGNNAVIAPHASTRDGLMDVVVMKPFKFYDVPPLALQMFTKNIDKNRRIKSFKAKEVVIKRKNKGAVHFDGEPAEMGTEIQFKIDPSSLNLIV